MIERVFRMLRDSDASGNARVPPTLIYSEGWLLRLALQWFEEHPDVLHPLAVPAGTDWYSEALLPTRFKATRLGDSKAESRTHADAVIGHVALEPNNARGLALQPRAAHFVVLEAKLKSGLSPGTRNAPKYGQAARNVACMAETIALSASPLPPEQMTALGFYVAAPEKQITRARLAQALVPATIRDAVAERIAAYQDPAYARWFDRWFTPMLDRMRIDVITWEAVVQTIARVDADDGAALDAFYRRCLFHSGLGEGMRAAPSRLPARAAKSEALAQLVAAHIRGLPDFEMVEDHALPYNHMGATITDAVLQAGLRYETVVWPRVQHVMTIPEAATTSGFLAVLRERGGEEVVHWTHLEKLGRMEAVAELFIAEGVETEADLRVWLCGDPAAGDGADAACGANIAKLAAVHGIGPKTIDYFKILCGEQDTAAIDMHLTRFLEQAGVRVTSYEQARDVIAGAAAELGVPAARLDHSIWTYMSKAGRTW